MAEWPELRLGSRLGAAFFHRDALVVAPDLLGKILVVDRSAAESPGMVALRVTEVEAYGGIGTDPGSHAHRSRTDRNSVMFSAGGRLYVYRSYGLHWCANVVTGADGIAAAVLLRAGEVVAGAGIARQRRTRTVADVAARDLARGPGRLCAALGIDGDLNRANLLSSAEVALHEPEPSQRPPGGAPAIDISTRTGVAGPGAGLPYRFYLRGDRTVSPHRPVRG